MTVINKNIPLKSFNFKATHFGITCEWYSSLVSLDNGYLKQMESKIQYRGKFDIAQILIKQNVIRYLI